MTTLRVHFSTKDGGGRADVDLEVENPSIVESAGALSIWENGDKWVATFPTKAVSGIVDVSKGDYD